MTKKNDDLHTPEENWADEHIKKAEKHALSKHEPHDVFLSKIVFWSGMVVVIIANLLLSIVLVPFLGVLNDIFLDGVVIVIGLVMGFLYNLLIIDIGHLERRHHILAAILLPLIAIVNVFIMVSVANTMIDVLAIQNAKQNPWLISILYGVAFIVPYLVDRTLVMLKKTPLLKRAK